MKEIIESLKRCLSSLDRLTVTGLDQCYIVAAVGEDLKDNIVKLENIAGGKKHDTESRKSALPAEG